MLVSLLVEQFAWDVNFYTDTHPGDHWKVVIEKQYLGGQFYKYGRLLAAEYGGKVGTFRSFFWAGKGAARDKPGKYYDDHGLAISKTMLKTPLRYVRISSKFDRKRFHPILHVEKAHLGIDYAAPQGTPVWASASGRVVEVGLKRGSGNTIVLAHANGLSTRYYHLSRYARGLHVGQQVKQKEVIGFVGMTGLATGPHLHFSVTKNGAFVDPSKLNVSRDAPVPDHAAFMDAIRPRIAALEGDPARRRRRRRQLTAPLPRSAQLSSSAGASGRPGVRSASAPEGLEAAGSGGGGGELGVVEEVAGHHEQRHDRPGLFVVGAADQERVGLDQVVGGVEERLVRGAAHGADAGGADERRRLPLASPGSPTTSRSRPCCSRRRCWPRRSR